MTDKQPKAFGTWPSPITPETITADNTTFDDVFVDPITSRVYYTERRPEENGRSVIIDAKSTEDVISSEFNARSAVHEYGGAAAVAYNKVIYFSNFNDNRVYTVDTTTTNPPGAVTPNDIRYRYANFAVHPTANHLVAAVSEYHPDLSNDDPEKVENGLCVINTTTKAQPLPLRDSSTTIFYAAPVFNPSGTKMAWQEWAEPWMPFEAGFIYVADVQIANDMIQLSNIIPVAGSEDESKPVSVNYPLWLSDTALLYTSDESGFANPYIYSTESGTPTAVLKSPINQDFCEPQWVFGLYPYAPIGNGDYGIFTAFENGRNILYVLNLKTPSDPMQITDFPFAVAEHVRQLSGNSFVFTGATSKQLPGVVLCALNQTFVGWDAEWAYFKQASLFRGLENYISLPQPVQVPDPDHPNENIQVVLYTPNNPEYKGLTNEKPPCITHVHGGPTSMEAQGLNLVKMYYTSRGFAWLDVNYRGSSGYGRAYIEQLAGNWGILDNKDCRTAVTYLDSQNKIDGRRAAVRGGSAGGYTTLCSVTSVSSAPTFYKAATSAYGGISNLLDLAKKTEKFELRYMWRLLGGPPDEIEQTYKDRSPFFNVDNKMHTPLLMLQGDQDFVVPRDQATQLAQEVETNAPNENFFLKLYAGEGHGFRKAENIRDVLKREHGWYQEFLL
ncbi:Alpha/Beta hydrolase protein [Scleroderma yunnanense]